MSEAKFTPGPWRIGKTAGSVVAEHPTGVMGADALDYYGGHLVAESCNDANARLIKASPRLFAALEAIVSERYEYVDPDPGAPDGSVERLYLEGLAALAEARGES